MADRGVGGSLASKRLAALLRRPPLQEVPFPLPRGLAPVVQQRVLRRAPISWPREYGDEVTLSAGSYRVLGHTDGGLRFALSLQVAAKPTRRDIQVPLVARWPGGLLSCR